MYSFYIPLTCYGTEAVMGQQDLSLFAEVWTENDSKLNIPLRVSDAVEFV